MRDAIERDFLDAVEAIAASGKPVTYSAVARKAGHARRLISSDRSGYPAVRAAIAAKKPADPPRRRKPRPPISLADVAALRRRISDLEETLTANLSATAAVLSAPSRTAQSDRREASMEERRAKRAQRKAAETVNR